MFATGSDTLDTKTAFNGAMADPAAFAKRVHLLWIGVGTKEPERMKQGIEKLHNSLNEAKIQHVFSESPGTDHEWQTWRRNLEDFASASVPTGRSKAGGCATLTGSRQIGRATMFRVTILIGLPAAVGIQATVQV